MPAAKNGAASQQVRRELARRRRFVRRRKRRGVVLVGRGRRGLGVLVGRVGHARIRLMLRDVDTDADDLFEQRSIGEHLMDEAPLAVGVE